MSWFERVTKTDQQTAEWISQARTPETRARIQRWSRVETFGVLLVPPGIVALTVAPLVTIALAIWFDVAGIDRTDVYWWLWGVTLGLLAMGLTASVIGSEKRIQASYADGHVSVGRIDEVIEQPASGDDPTWYVLKVSAKLSDGVVLRRNLDWGDENPTRWTGRPIRFRHNTLEPNDLHDHLYDGLPDRDATRKSSP